MKRGNGPKLPGGATAKRHAAVILEVLSGVRGPREGSEAMGVSLNRYYQLESRALGGLIAALEPRPKGRRTTPAQQVEALERDKRRLEQELGRHQALVRAAHRSLGLSTASPTRAAAKGSRVGGKGTQATAPKRRRRTVQRGAKVISALRRTAGPEPTATPSGSRSSSSSKPAAAEASS
jgi:hypothetical protein